MKTLILKKTRAHYGESHWSDNDYVVLDAGQIIGRIFRHPQAPQGQPWFWTITAREQPPSVHNHGYSISREQAMSDFKVQLA
jgi:hypothetical protein